MVKSTNHRIIQNVVNHEFKLKN